MRGRGRDGAVEKVVERFALIAGDQAGRAVETPLADTAGVDVDKVGVRIVTHAAATQGESRLAQPERVDIAPFLPYHQKFRTQVNLLLKNLSRFGQAGHAADFRSRKERRINTSTMLGHSADLRRRRIGQADRFRVRRQSGRSAIGVARPMCSRPICRSGHDALLRPTSHNRTSRQRPTRRDQPAGLLPSCPSPSPNPRTALVNPILPLELLMRRGL